MENGLTRRRVIVLGASNVSLGLSMVVDLIRAGFSGPLQIDIGDGHGRSYGAWTSIPFRALPGHVDSKIWHPPESASDQQFALMTDIGNDLIYDASVEQISQWVRTCAERLVEQNAWLVMTRLPLGSIATLGRARYLFFRSIFFPACRISLDEIRSRALQLNEEVLGIAEDVGATVVEPENSWYGLDPIHIRQSDRQRAWGTMMMHWPDWQGEAEVVRSSISRRIELLRAKPRDYRSWGRFRESTSSIRLGDNAEIRFY